jgi:hypothetical protein
MRRWLLGILAFLALGQVAEAQFTTVSAVVTDVSGNVYSNCRGNADFVPSPTATKVPLLSGSTFQTSVPIAACDSFGSFTLILADNALVSDGHTGGTASQWRISLCSNTTPPVCFNAVLTITGATQNISAALQAASAPLPVSSKTLLNAQPSAAPITGTGAAATIYTYTLPAGTIGLLKGFRFTIGINHSTGTQSIPYIVSLNGQTILNSSTSVTGPINIYGSVLNTAPTTGTFIERLEISTGGVTPNNGILTGLAWSSPQVLTVNFNASATDQVTPFQWIVEIIQ